jgi:hypothetical protein
MTLKNNVVQGVIGLVSLGVLAMAGQWWISQEVSSQLAAVSIPDTAQLTTDVEVIKTTVLATSAKADTAIANQQRFEEIFTEYLINEANR